MVVAVLDTPSEGFIKSVNESMEDEVQRAVNTVEKGRYFLNWVLPRVFEFSPEELGNQITDKADENGIDAYKITYNEGDGSIGGTISLFQVKYGKSYDLNKEISHFEDEVTCFLKSKTQDIKRDDMKELHHRIKTEKLEPELYFITNQEVTFDKKGKVNVFGKNQIVQTIWDDLVSGSKGRVENLILEDFMKYGDNALIGVLSIANLIKFIGKTKKYIFESNIRKYLKHTKVNKFLLETIGDPLGLEKVFYYNNGITIVVKDFEVKDHTLKLHEPQIVNGAQTSSTIYEKLNYSELIKGNIQVTVIKETKEIPREEITRFRNSQNAVKGKDLISLERFHKEIRLQLHNFGYFYETQVGTWINMTKSEKSEYKGRQEDFNNYLPENHDHRIPATEAIQAMVAGFFQNPTQPYSSISSFMPSGKHYDDIFTSDLDENHRLLLYPYLIKCYSETLGYGKQDADPEVKRYARLLFVATYFKILFERVLKIENEDAIKKPEILDKYMKNTDVNKELLRFVDTVLENYFNRAEEYMQEKSILTWHNFFSKYAWDTPLQKTIEIAVKNKRKELDELIKKF